MKTVLVELDKLRDRCLQYAAAAPTDTLTDSAVDAFNALCDTMGHECACCRPAPFVVCCARVFGCPKPLAVTALLTVNAVPAECK